MKKDVIRIFAICVIVLLVGLIFNFKTESVFISVLIFTTAISLEKRITALSKSSPLFEKVSYKVRLYNIDVLNNLQGATPSLVNLKSLDRIILHTINQGSKDLYLIVFNPYMKEACDCLVFTSKDEQIQKYKEITDKLTTK